jgi:hypothetical protein
LKAKDLNILFKIVRQTLHLYYFLKFSTRYLCRSLDFFKCTTIYEYGPIHLKHILEIIWKYLLIFQHNPNILQNAEVFCTMKDNQLLWVITLISVWWVQIFYRIYISELIFSIQNLIFFFLWYMHNYTLFPIWSLLAKKISNLIITR